MGLANSPLHALLTILLVGNSLTVPASAYVLSEAPRTTLAIEDCSIIDGLTNEKRLFLTDALYTKCINVVGVLVVGQKYCDCDNNMYYVANLLGEMLDLDRDGRTDAPNILQNLGSFDLYGLRGAVQDKGFMVVGDAAVNEEVPEVLGRNVVDVVGQPIPSRGWQAQDEATWRQIVTEETFHFVQRFGWHIAYFREYGMDWHSNICLLTQRAQCIWHMHPSNLGCSTLEAEKCPNPDEGRGNPPMPVCRGECMEYRADAVGQCWEGYPQGCAGAGCDCIEFFQKLYMGWLEDPTVSEPASTFYQLEVAAGLAPPNLRAKIEAKLQESPQGRNMFAVMNSTDFKLPKSRFTGVYFTPTASPTGAPTSSPTASPTASPTDSPTTLSPTPVPTSHPTMPWPTPAPTEPIPPPPAPTRTPTQGPTTAAPTYEWFDDATESPTKSPTPAPTPAPTAAPTLTPTWAPYGPGSGTSALTPRLLAWLPLSWILYALINANI